ncbi:MAG TPA: GGDEF domain-containing protein [Negativicutes bacterium]|jgi:diguanylate cyclase (GGDEF)-like protein
MFCNYNYAPWTLAGLGVVASLTDLYLDMACPLVFNKWLLRLGICLVLGMTGFIIGGLLQKLSIRSHTDFLTGLWNRRYFYLRLNQEENRATKRKTPLSIALIDVDGFKTINDTYGHAIGDILLSDIAAILKKNTRATAVVTRWGGDEFAIIFSETSLVEASEVIDRVRYKVENAFSPYHLTISAGIIALKPDQDLKDLLIKADQALYKAKMQKNTTITVTDL